MRNILIKMILRIFKSKVIFAILGITILTTTVIGSVYFVNSNIKANSLITEITTQTESASETEIQTETTTIQETTTVKLVAVKDLKIGADKSTPPAQVVNSGAELPIYEVPGMTYGVDVSKWQGNIDWASMKAAGVQFAMIKCGGRNTNPADPSLYEDSKFKQNIEGALANGIQVGVYFFSQALNEYEALEEASYCLYLIKGYKLTYPVAFDWEGFDTPSYRVYQGNNSFTTESLTAISSTFCDAVKSAGYSPMHYGNPKSFGRWAGFCGFSNSVLGSKYKTWLAVWPSDSASRPPTTLVSSYSSMYTFQMWQYGSTDQYSAFVSGTKIVDVNIAYFGYAGSQASTTAIKLNITNSSLTTNIGTSINLLNGVTASNTVGTDVSSSVTCTIKNMSGVDFTSSDAFSTSFSLSSIREPP